MSTGRSRASIGGESPLAARRPPAMNRPDMYIKQAHAMAAWLRAQGDEAGAELADSFAEHLYLNHEAVDDQTMPDWTVGPRMDALDTEPAIRCWPEVGCVFEGEDGPVLTIDPCDGGDVSIVHMGDVVRWMEARLDADASAQAQLDAERQAYDATVGSGYATVGPGTATGEVIDAEFEMHDELVAAQEAADPFNIDPPPGYGDVAPARGRADTSWPAREYMSDDVDIEPNRLRLDQGGNGDWYLAILKPGERMGVAVRITTSGTRSSAPDMPLAVFKLYQAMGGERIGLSAAFESDLDDLGPHSEAHADEGAEPQDERMAALELDAQADAEDDL